MSILVVSIDLGQANDFTAMVIVEARGAQREVTTNGRTRIVEMMPLVQVDVRWIERLNEKVRYTYTEMALMVRQRIRQLAVEEPRKPRYFVVDRTGVGMGVIEMFAELSPIGITITGGNQVTRAGDQDYNVPKRDLVSPAQVLLQNHVLRIAASLPHAELLKKELLAFRQKISISGHDTYEAWREAAHDDLVLALGMAIWTAQTTISTSALGHLGAGRWEDPPQISPF